MQNLIRTPDIDRTPAPEIDASPLLYRFAAQLSFAPLGIVPEGLRMANSFEGTVTDGILEGGRVWGVDHLLVRRDGVAVIDAQKAISLGDRHVYEHVHGYCLPPEGMDVPPLEVMVAPGFNWPDIEFPIIGASTFRSALPELAYLNRSVAGISGAANFATGFLTIETRLLPRGRGNERLGRR
jgi:hypothetical protein